MDVEYIWMILSQQKDLKTGFNNTKLFIVLSARVS